jgi:enamine deaminase RidA (YjgF/YER057c/UK114 family)
MTAEATVTPSLDPSPTPEQRLSALGIELPPVRPPAGTFVHAVRSGSMLYVGGQVPFRADGTLTFGRLGDDLDTAAGYAAARDSAMVALAAMRAELGSLDSVRRIVRVYGVVNCTPDFREHTLVVNGASDLFVAVFGDAGQHARLAVGVNSLPWNIALEIEVTAEVA